MLDWISSGISKLYRRVAQVSAESLALAKLPLFAVPYIYMEQVESNQLPYQNLGNRLRDMRERAKETLADVSGAVEIDVNQLTEIESGTKRPSEDILLLLMSHFNVKEDEAMQLYELAGYEERLRDRVQNLMNDEHGQPQPAVMVLPIDARVVYSDMVHVMVNNYGVIMNFMQGVGPNNQPMAISRIGMSKEHAKSVLEVLKKTLEDHTKEEQSATGAKVKKPSKTTRSSRTERPRSTSEQSNAPTSKTPQTRKSTVKKMSTKKPRSTDNKKSQ